jgi:hypothetical protein
VLTLAQIAAVRTSYHLSEISAGQCAMKKSDFSGCGVKCAVYDDERSYSLFRAMSFVCIATGKIPHKDFLDSR